MAVCVRSTLFVFACVAVARGDDWQLGRGSRAAPNPCQPTRELTNWFSLSRLSPHTAFFLLPCRISASRALRQSFMLALLLACAFSPRFVRSIFFLLLLHHHLISQSRAKLHILLPDSRKKRGEKSTPRGFGDGDSSTDSSELIPARCVYLPRWMGAVELGVTGRVWVHIHKHADSSSSVAHGLQYAPTGTQSAT